MAPRAEAAAPAAAVRPPACRDRARCPTGRRRAARRDGPVPTQPRSASAASSASSTDRSRPPRGGTDSVASNGAGPEGTPMSGLSRSKSTSIWLSRSVTSDTDVPYCDGTGTTDCGSVLAPSGSTIVPPSSCRSGAPPAWYSELSGSIWAPSSCVLVHSSPSPRVSANSCVASSSKPLMSRRLA